MASEKKLSMPTFVFFLVGAALAFAIGFAWSTGDDSRALDRAFEGSSLDQQALNRRILQIESAVATLGARVTALQEAAQQGQQGQGGGRAPQPGGPIVPGSSLNAREAAARAAQLESTNALFESILTAEPTLSTKLETEVGFTAERAQDIAMRVEEFTVEAMEVQARQGTVSTPRDTSLERRRYIGRALRDELGDADYERYRIAAGLPTDTVIKTIEPDSTAARAGLQPGDVIVAYDGKRVMDLTELEEFVEEGSLNGSSTIELRREGQSMHLLVPSGPLGVTERNLAERFREGSRLDSE